MEGKNDVKTCTRDESCQSNSLHEIPNLDFSPEVRVHVCFSERLKGCHPPHELGELWNVEYELMEEG